MLAMCMLLLLGDKPSFYVSIGEKGFAKRDQAETMVLSFRDTSGAKYHDDRFQTEVNLLKICNMYFDIYIPRCLRYLVAD